MINKTTLLIRLIFLLAVSLQSPYLFGETNTSNNILPSDTIISDPISIDSLFITPSMPREGDIIRLWAATTHSSSPCGLLNFTITSSSANIIYVDAKYWEGMLTTICHSLDSMQIGSLCAGKYVLNFMNEKKIAFTVYPKTNVVADFTYMYPKCLDDAKCYNTVQFIDKSIGNIQNWYWDFGDSTHSTLQNPGHFYKTQGIYNVCLRVSSSAIDSKGNTKCKLVPVPASNCKAQFKYQKIDDPSTSSVDSSAMPFPSHLVSFTDISAGEVIKWEWDFGDGSFSTIQNPVHRYRDGVFLATLSITTKQGCSSKFSDSLVLFSTQPVCQYTGTVKDYTGLDGCKFIIELDNGLKIEPVIVPMNFVFRDNQRVIIDYLPLKVASICMVGITAEITCIRELITPECKAFFTYAKDTNVNCICYNFFDQSIGKVINWHWDFGDGTSSNQQNPSHAFTITSTTPFYTVCLTIKTADSCSSTYCEKVFVQSSIPWVPIIGGKEHHHILIPSCIKTSENLEYGDYIGLFFRDYVGKLICGGMIEWKEKTDVLTAWANTTYMDSIIIMGDSIYPIPYRKNGFNPNEKFNYKIWKWRTNTDIYMPNADYKVSKVFPDSGFYKNNGVSLLQSITASNGQIITLYSGWNLVSLYVIPDNPYMEDIFGNLDVIVKDPSGEIVYPSFWDKNIDLWSPYEGYKIHAKSDIQIKVPGKNIDPQTNIPLPGTKYPAFLPYYYTKPYPIEFMMQGVKNNIRYIQSYELVSHNIQGLNYIPKYDINEIKYMKPGLAYKFSLYTAMRSFTYPPLITPMDTSFVDHSLTKPKFPTGENNRVLVIPEKILPISPGASIAVFINNKCVGYNSSTAGNNAITLWDIDSITTTDNFILEIMGNNQILKYNLSFSKNTDVDGDLNVLTNVTTSTPDLISESFFIRVYPSPASQEFYINLSLDKPQIVEVSLFDLIGRKIKQTNVNTASAGVNRIIMPVTDVATGQYIYQVKTSNKVQRGKIHVIR